MSDVTVTPDFEGGVLIGLRAAFFVAQKINRDVANAILKYVEEIENNNRPIPKMDPSVLGYGIMQPGDLGLNDPAS